MNTIQIFNSPQFGQIRVAQTVNGEPIFCLTDICSSLELSNNRKVKSQLDDDVTLSYPIVDNLGRSQEATFVTEAGMYTVILRSDSPKAKPMQKWVTSEVLPSIRKHGTYATDVTVERMIDDPDFAIKLLTNLKEEKQKRVEAEKLNEANKPKLLFAQAVETSQKSCLIGELAKVLKQNGIEIGQNRLFEWLRQNNYLCSKGEAYNQPTQRSMELGLFELKKTTINKPDGSILVSTTVKVTGKGQIYFVNRFLNN